MTTLTLPRQRALELVAAHPTHINRAPMTLIDHLDMLVLTGHAEYDDGVYRATDKGQAYLAALGVTA